MEQQTLTKAQEPVEGISCQATFLNVYEKLSERILCSLTGFHITILVAAAGFEPTTFGL